MLLLPLLLLAPPACWATDGDSIRCGAERIRLLAIDAPEMPGHCRQGRACAPGDPFRSKASLVAAMKLGPITVSRISRDRYGRTLAIVHAGSINLNCWQLTRRHATYRARWDNGARVASTCPSAAK